MKKYKLLLFDADGTLYDFNKAERYALRKTFSDFNLKYNENKVLKLFKEVNSRIWKEFEKGEITAEKLKSERFKRFFEIIGINKVSFEEAGSKYLQNLSEENSLLPGAESFIKEIEKDYTLVLITNGLTLVQRKRLYNSEISKYWDAIIISEEVGYPKPKKEIFDFTFDKINCLDKSKALIIGDNLASDILGGINYGIDTCWFNPQKKLNNTEIKPTYEVAKYYQLKMILNS